MSKKSRGERNVGWIEKFCCFADGPYRGRPVYLSAEEREAVCSLYDAGAKVRVTGPLAAYLALLSICGPEALLKGASRPARPVIAAVDVWTVWRAASPELQRVLTRRGEAIICPELGTSYRASAAA